MNRYAARIGSVLALALSLPLCAAAPANAAENATYVYNGKRIVFQTLIDRPAGPAVSADDPGLHALVSAKGATLTWDQENQYILITFPGPTVISFAIGDPHYLVGSVTGTAAFAPFMRDNHPYVPLNDVLRALKLPPLSTISPTAAPATARRRLDLARWCIAKSAARSSGTSHCSGPERVDGRSGARTRGQ